MPESKMTESKIKGRLELNIQAGLFTTVDKTIKS